MPEITDWETSSNVSDPSVPAPEPTTAVSVEAPAASVEPTSDATQAEPAAEDTDSARDEQGRFKGRHRARSQQAGPEDVPRIKELTRRLRETEAKVAELSKPKDTSASSLLPPTPSAAAPSGFTDPEPTLEQFSDKPDPYSAWMRATNAWDRKKEAFEAKQADEHAKAEQAQKQGADYWAKVNSDFQAKAKAFQASTPDYAKRIAAVPARYATLPALLDCAVVLSEDGPAQLMYLYEHPSILDELIFLTDGKAITDQSVAIAQRLIQSRSKDGTTGSSAPVPLTLAPRPPNPVRTAPTTPPDQLPGDDASLEEHERAFQHPRRRRRA